MLLSIRHRITQYQQYRFGKCLHLFVRFSIKRYLIINNIIQFRELKQNVVPCISDYLRVLCHHFSSTQQACFIYGNVKKTKKQQLCQKQNNKKMTRISLAFVVRVVISLQGVSLLETTKSTFSLINTSCALNALNIVKVYAKIFAAFPISMEKNFRAGPIKTMKDPCVRMYNELNENKRALGATKTN